MKKDFKQKGKEGRRYRVTDLNTGEAHSLRAENITSLEVHSVNHTKIIYRDEVEENTLREIFAYEDCDALVKLLNGQPNEAKYEILRHEVEQEIAREMAEELVALHDDFEREDKKHKTGYDGLYQRTQKFYDDKQEEFDRLNTKLQSTRRHRVADWLYEAQLKAGYEGQKKRQGFLNAIYAVITPANIQTLIEIRNSTGSFLAEKDQKLAQVLESNTHDKNARQYSFEQEKLRLERLRQHPAMSHECQGRLEKRIREYRLEHGDDANFKFVEQSPGRFENIRSKEFQEARALSMKEAIDQRRPNRRDGDEDSALELTRGRSRTRSRGGYDRGR